MKLPSSLKNSLTVHFLAVAALPLLVFGLISSEYLARRQLEKIEAALHWHAFDIRDETTIFLGEVLRDLNLVRDAIAPQLLQDPQQVDNYLRMTVANYPHFESLFVLDSDRRVRFLGLNRALVEHEADYRDLDFSSRGIFSDSRTIEEPTWSETFISPATGQPSISLALSLPGGRVLFGTIGLQWLSDFLARSFWSYPDHEFAVLDSGGTVIAHSQGQLARQRISLREHPEVARALAQGREVDFKYHEDRSLLESVCLIPGPGWVVYVSQLSEVAHAPIQRMRWLLAGILGLAMLAGALISWLVSRRLVRPVTRLQNATRQIAAGHYDQPPGAVGYSELDELAVGFRQMAVAVRDREASLRDSQARFQSLIESIEGIVWELDFKSFRFTYVSHQAEKTLGYPVSDWLEQEDFWSAHIHPDDREWAMEFCLSQSAGHRDHQFEYRMLASDGRVVWLKDLVNVVVEAGQVAYLRGVMIDVTPRKNAEFRLLEVRDRLQLMIDRMPLGCIVWDTGCRIESWNPAAEKLFGFKAEDMRGRTPSNLIAPEPLTAREREIWESLLSGNHEAHSIHRNLTRDGRRIVCEWHKTPLRDETGRVVGAIAMVHDITDRQKGELALRESEARARTIFQTSPDAVLISRLEDGVILDVNDRAVALTGYASEELVGHKAFELGLWENPADRERFLTLVGEQGFVANYEARFKMADQTLRTGLISARRVVLDGQNCLMSVLRDITEIKSAETNLRRSEERFRSLVSVMGEGLVIQTRDGRIVECNRAAEQILNLTRDQLVGRSSADPAWQAVHEDGSPFPGEDHPAMVTFRTGETIKNRLMGLRMPDDTVRWIQINTQPLALDADGRPSAVVVTFAEVTQLKRVEEGLRASEGHLRQLSRQFEVLLQAIPDRIMVLDRHLRITWINRHSPNADGAFNPAIVGTPCHEIVGMQCNHLVQRPDDPDHLCLAARCLRDGCTVEERFTTPSGRIFAMRAFPIRDEVSGEIVSVIEISQDITRNVRLQEQTMRAGQLAALGELAAGVAHEINNPINGIINYAQLILNRSDAASREAEILRRIQREGDRIATIVKELLYFARDDGHETTTVSLREAVDEALTLTATQLRKEGVVLQVDVPADLPVIQSQGHQVQQLILNLISNARHALVEKFPVPDPDMILAIRGETVAVDGQTTVRLRVRDQGSGIPEALLPRVLNPFVTTKPSGVGTGLGLSISHEIVQKHGGRIDIESEFGRFTAVTVDFPVIDPHGQRCVPGSARPEQEL